MSETKEDAPRSKASDGDEALSPRAVREGDSAAGEDEHAETREDGRDDATSAMRADGAPDATTTPAAEDSAADEEEEDDFLPRGNPLRLKRGVVAIVAGVLPAFFLMAKNTQASWALPLGALFVMVAAWGVMDLLGTFDDPEDRVVARTTLGALGAPLALTVGGLAAFGGSLALAQSGATPWWVASLIVTLSFLGLVVTIFRLGQALGPWRLDEEGEERPLLYRHGFWVVAIGGLLYLPALGLQSLWDPWETHYGEVAREILARDDWVSLWWAQENFFWSKPILNFWIQSLSMATLGTHYQPDLMLIGAGGAAVAQPEWAMRAPNALMTIAAMYFLYKGVARVFGRRAGLLGAIVLATAPDWFFLAHQTMTDMPFVAAMTAAMGLLLLGLNTDEDETVKVYEVEAFGAKWRLSLWHLVFGAVLLCALPQIVYLLSRNLEIIVAGDGPKGFRFHWDEVMRGSGGGNCGLPGNEACSVQAPASVPKSVGAHPEGAWKSVIRYFGGVEPSLQAIVWSLVLAGVFYLSWGERRVRRLVYVGAWLCAAIATMAKGPAGFGLPILCAFAYVATKRRFGELLKLEMMTGLLIILGVAIPWYVAMYVRHGSPFTDRLIFHDMYNRAFSHVHDTNVGDDTGIRYYLWQLGYALFPWTGLAPLGLLWGFRRSDSALARAKGSGPGAAVGDASVMLVMWFLFAYALFTFMGTKFHHYIFPAVPPVAMLIGIALDDMLGQGRLARRGSLPLYLAGLGVAIGIGTWGVSRFWPGSFLGAAPLPGSQPAAFVGPMVAAVGLVLAGGVAWLLGDRTNDAGDDNSRGDDGRSASYERLVLGSAAVLAAIVTAIVGRDLALKPETTEQPGAIRLLQLFTYNYKRPWPESLDFSAIITGFAIVGTLLALAMAARGLRRHALVGFFSLAILWAVWGIDVYMVKMSPHWGQRELMQAYYQDRKSPDELLVAYQMNWKGENFYTGNRIPAFVSTGNKFQTWLKEQREQGKKVMYFVTEHSRVAGLRSEVAGKGYTELTDKALCNKFVVVRVEL